MEFGGLLERIRHYALKSQLFPNLGHCSASRAMAVQKCENFWAEESRVSHRNLSGAHVSLPA